MRQRIEYFDQMKGVAILLVVIGHVMQFSFGIPKSNVVDMLSIFHMPIFFFVSGYFIYKESLTLKETASKCLSRARTLLLPYGVFLLVWCIFSKSNIVDLLMSGGERYWFLNALFVISIIYILWGLIINRITNKYMYIGLVLIPIIFIKLFVVLGYSIEVICLSQLDTFAKYFVVGLLCRKFEGLFKALSDNPLIYALSFMLFILQWFLTGRSNFFLITLGALGAIIVILQSLKNVSVNSRILSWFALMGRNSLAIYLLHYFFIPDVSAWFKTWIVLNPFIFHLTASLIASIPIIVSSLFVSSLINKNVYLKYLLLGHK